jgi:preprotein translocase subunit SecG
MTLRKRLTLIAALLAIVGALACFAVVVGLLQPSRATLEQRAADRAAWAKTQTAEQRESAAAWDAALSRMRREQGLMALVFVSGVLLIIVIVSRSTRSAARKVDRNETTLRRAGAAVLSRAAVALLGAFAVMVLVPVVEGLFIDSYGMYEGEQSAVAILTAAAFVLVWVAALSVSIAVLWRRRRDAS